jgi:hypothetical protein
MWIDRSESFHFCEFVSYLGLISFVVAMWFARKIHQLIEQNLFLKLLFFIPRKKKKSVNQVALFSREISVLTRINSKHRKYTTSFQCKNQSPFKYFELSNGINNQAYIHHQRATLLSHTTIVYNGGRFKLCDKNEQRGDLLSLLIRHQTARMEKNVSKPIPKRQLPTPKS